LGCWPRPTLRWLTASWPQFGHDLRKTRFNPDQTVIARDTVGSLNLEYVAAGPANPNGFDSIQSTMTVANGVLYASAVGFVFAFDANGCGAQVRNPLFATVTRTFSGFRSCPPYRPAWPARRAERNDLAGPSSAAEIKSSWQLRAMRKATALAPAQVRVSVSGDVPSGTAEYAQAKIATAAGHVREPVLHARARITANPNPAAQRPVVAEVNLDLNGTPVRAQVNAPTAREAIDLLEARLRRRLDRLSRRRDAKRSRTPASEPDQWRQEAEHANQPTYSQQEPGERRIIRHKSFTAAPATIDDAASEMDAMDYEFHLFTEVGSGQDSVIYRAGPTGLQVAQVNPAPAALNSFSVPATISTQPAPLLSVDEAADQLGLRGLPFLFYLDAEHARGCVLYRRYDGHYGLISPAE